VHATDSAPPAVDVWHSSVEYASAAIDKYKHRNPALHPSYNNCLDFSRRTTTSYRLEGPTGLSVCITRSPTGSAIFLHQPRRMIIAVIIWASAVDALYIQGYLESRENSVEASTSSGAGTRRPAPASRGRLGARRDSMAHGGGMPVDSGPS